jgi:hypothetical protein
VLRRPVEIADRHVTKVVLGILRADDSLPMWRAVPATSKSSLFSHSLGREQPLNPWFRAALV